MENLSSFIDRSLRLFDLSLGKLNVGLRAQWRDRVSASMWAHYVGPTLWDLNLSTSSFRKNVDDYTLLNARVSASVWKDRAEISLTGSNLLNQEKLHYPLGDKIGTRVLCWVRLKY